MNDSSRIALTLSLGLASLGCTGEVFGGRSAIGGAGPPQGPSANSFPFADPGSGFDPSTGSCNASNDMGESPMQRLTREQFSKAVRDLLCSKRASPKSFPSTFVKGSFLPTAVPRLREKSPSGI
jgi:hypothetical protein